jgi:hypothetical protein
MADLVFRDMRLVSAVELDPRTIQLTVIERWSEKRWMRTVEYEQQRTFTLQVGVGRWHDGEHFVLRQDPRHFRLMELWEKHRLEQKLDNYIERPTAMPPAQRQRVGPLPPVPVLRPTRSTPR